MEVEVKVEDLLKKIEDSVREYESDFEKSLKIYKSKMEEYIIYLEREINSKPEDRIHFKPPPYLSHWRRDDFITTMAALKAHQKPTVVMSSMEYDGLLKGIKSSHEALMLDTANISSINYIQ